MSDLLTYQMEGMRPMGFSSAQAPCLNQSATEIYVDTSNGILISQQAVHALVPKRLRQKIDAIYLSTSKQVKNWVRVKNMSQTDNRGLGEGMGDIISNQSQIFFLKGFLKNNMSTNFRTKLTHVTGWHF